MRKQSDKVTERHNAIKELIQKEPIGDQETLVKKLKKTYGIDVNQSIVSRDLVQCGISKKRVHDALVYDIAAVDARKEILRLSVTNVTHNEALIVVKTFSGSAAFVAEFLDVLDDDMVLGTVAGDNTIFITPRSIKNIRTVYEHVCELLYFNHIGKE